MMRLAAWTGAAGLVVFLSLPLAAQKLPDGKGKDLVERECTKCHGLEGITRTTMTKERWASIVDDMVSRGASGTDQEIDQIIDYLAANFGKVPAGAKAEAPKKVNVNTATAKELAAALELSDENAAAIVAYREKNGNFKDIDTLKKVPGLDAQKIDAKKDRLEF